MATKQMRPTEAARRRSQRSRDTLANAAHVTLGSKQGDVGLDKRFDPPVGPQDDVTVRKMAPPARRYWPSANSQRAPRRPQGSRRSPK